MEMNALDFDLHRSPWNSTKPGLSIASARRGMERGALSRMGASDVAACMITGFVVFSPVAPGARVDAQMVHHESPSEIAAAKPAPTLTTQEKLKSIRSVLDLSTTALAELIGVSRPTIYQWIKGQGEPQSQEHRARIDRLATCAVTWNKAFPAENMDHWFTDSEPDQASLMDLLRQDTQKTAVIDQLMRTRIRQAHEANQRIEAARKAAGVGVLPAPEGILPENIYRWNAARLSMRRAAKLR